MGQRTAILLKKNFGNNRSTITLIHHQWGIGKTMPAYLIEEVLRSVYPLNRRHESFYRDGDTTPIETFYTFEPLSNPDNNYITNKEVATDDKEEDIWNPQVRIKYGKMTDNNNGMMLVEVTQNFRGNGEIVDYGDMLSVKVGFCLGYEEVYYWDVKLDESIQLERAFDRLVSMEEFAVRTWETGKAFSKKFVKACRTILEMANVEEIYDKEGAKKRIEREKHIKDCIKALTRNVPKGTMISVPEELKMEEPIFK